MDWTDIILTVGKADAETAQAIALLCAPGGIYVEDYSDLALEAPQIAPAAFIADELLAKQDGPVTIHLYFPPEQDVAPALKDLEGRFTRAGISYTLATASLRQKDWENGWRAFYHPVAVGRHFVVCPAWEPADTGAGPFAGRTPLLIDPGLAFGSGTHETTTLCLAMAEDRVTPGCRVLDVGCGSGILSIGACLLGAGEALGIDIDAMAVRTSAENAALNGVEGRYTARVGNLADHVTGRYDLILANIVAGAIAALAPAIPPLLAPGGVFIASGIIEEKQELVLDALDAAGLELTETRQKRGWVAMAAVAKGEKKG